jgi:hypothetical protein
MYFYLCLSFVFVFLLKHFVLLVNLLRFVIMCAFVVVVGIVIVCILCITLVSVCLFCSRSKSRWLVAIYLQFDSAFFVNNQIYKLK